MNFRAKVGIVFFSIPALVILGVLSYFIFKPNKYDIEMKKAYAIKKAHPEIKAFDGYEEPPIPNDSENEKTLFGLDVNKNGLRDDVEIWINRTHADPNIRNALRQVHQAYQEIMTIGPNIEGKKPDAEKANQFYTNNHRASSCLYAFYPSYAAYSFIANFFYGTIQNNTSKRAKKFITGADQLTIPIGGPVLDNSEIIKAYCKFKVENKNEKE